ncbi:MAG: hypothetical protein HY243_02420 [Proteobacteria bacterium]|nr:hypothetical protein [Pseudomonadota bacterium]
MAISTTGPALAADRALLSDRWLALAAWAFVAGLSIVQTVLHPQAFFLSTDDAMRLTEVRDLLAGQGWFDLTQQRMNVPFGVAMHWSHVVDAGIAALILLFRMFANTQTAETGALWAWPLLTLLPAFFALRTIGARLAGREGAAIVLLLGVSCLALLGIFQPGRIDHHNLQLALGISMVACLIEYKEPKGMALAGGLAAFSLAIGLETLPYVLLAGAVVGVIWVIQGSPLKPAMRVFGGVFAGAAAILFFAATATAERVTASCDTYSLFYAPLAMTGGIGLVAMGTITMTSLRDRAFAFAGLAIVLVALAASINPQCLAGPLSTIDAQLDAIWLSRIEEVQPAWRFAFLEPGYFVSGYLYALACFLATLAAAGIASRELRAPWIVLALFNAMALAIATAEVRGMNFAILFGLPGMAGFVAMAAARIQSSKLSSLGRAGVVIIALFLASNVAFEFASRAFASSAKDEQSVAHSGFTCFQAATLQVLDTLPPGRIAAFIDQGPGILAYTKHAVVAGPYHRGANGIIDTYTIFAGREAQARQILEQRGIDYVVVCPSSPDYTYYGQRNGLIARLQRHDVPHWLTPMTASTPELQIFRVVGDKL